MKGQRKQIFSVSVRVCENIHQRDLCDCECELLPPMKVAQIPIEPKITHTTPVVNGVHS
jgi:hypothetical protein